MEVVVEGDLEVDLEVEGDSKEDFRGDLDFKQLSSSGQVRSGPGLI